MPRAFVTGLAGKVLSADERAFLAEAQPFGLIVFRRNIEDGAQLARLVDDFRDAVGRRAPVLVDQEGGRVQRLNAPHWRAYPSAARLVGAAAVAGDGALVGDVASLMAADLAAVGIDVDCAPCLDLAIDGATSAIGDRSFGASSAQIIAAGRAFAEGLMAGGVLPVIKHIPGHGRAVVDSHLELPRVTVAREDLEGSDFSPFAALADLPAAMTAHVVYDAIDPERPATQSPTVIEGVIRGAIGFDGLLFSDDLSMKALSGSLADRARASLVAGCDVALYCAGVLDEMIEVADAVPPLSGKPLVRAERALNAIPKAGEIDGEAIARRLAAALSALDASV